ncbi:hypothetical protein BJX61DRAFT_544762 [Aspergillus egyptiacus]|nr:hypothetical protein BJX61DRAFT_544762 [Aspergillus egyptiacus]
MKLTLASLLLGLASLTVAQGSGPEEPACAGTFFGCPPDDSTLPYQVVSCRKSDGLSFDEWEARGICRTAGGKSCDIFCVMPADDLYKYKATCSTIGGTVQPYRGFESEQAALGALTEMDLYCRPDGDDDLPTLTPVPIPTPSV